MKIDFDYVRKIVLYIEENSKFGSYITDNELFTALKITDSDDNELNNLCYYVRYLDEAGILSNVKFYVSGGFIIDDLTPQGHEFAQNIRNDTTWNKIKDKTSEIGSYSMNVIVQIASTVVSNLITKSFGG